MPDEITESTGTESAETTETTEKPAANSVDELPKWARDALSKANNEAARYRTGLRDAEARLAQAKTPDDFEAAVAEVKTRNAALEHELLVERTARKHGLPDDLAARLRGTTEAELEADATALKKYVAAEKETPVDLNGGLDPNDDDDFDPVKAALAARQTRY